MSATHLAEAPADSVAPRARRVTVRPKLSGSSRIVTELQLPRRLNQTPCRILAPVAVIQARHSDGVDHPVMARRPAGSSGRDCRQAVAMPRRMRPSFSTSCSCRACCAISCARRSGSSGDRRLLHAGRGRPCAEQPGCGDARGRDDVPGRGVAPIAPGSKCDIILIING
jgi:hypothetical protein